MSKALTVGENLRKLREARGYTQSYVENKLGWGRGSLSNYERGTNNIPEDRKDQIVEFYGLGENKVATFFAFKETKTPDPEPDHSKTSMTHNNEGYVDTTMAKALANAMVKYTDPMPGEIWLNVRVTGNTLHKLILNVSGNTAYCLTVFSNGSSKDFKVKDKSGNVWYVAFDRMEAIKLKELKERRAVVMSNYFEDTKLHFAATVGIAVVEKEVEVIKEVPVEVEKEVIKEVPVEVEKECSFEFEMCKRECDIYKDIVDRLLPQKMTV